MFVFFRCVLREGVEELRDVSMGEEYSDVPVGDRRHTAGCVRDGGSTGDGERLLLRIYAMGLLCGL